MLLTRFKNVNNRRLAVAPEDQLLPQAPSVQVSQELLHDPALADAFLGHDVSRECLDSPSLGFKYGLAQLVGPATAKKTIVALHFRSAALNILSTFVCSIIRRPCNADGAPASVIAMRQLVLPDDVGMREVGRPAHSLNSSFFIAVLKVNEDVTISPLLHLIRNWPSRNLPTPNLIARAAHLQPISRPMSGIKAK